MSTDDFIEFGERLLESERLRFRITTEDDYELLHSWWLDPTVMMLQSVGAALLKDRDSIIGMFRAWSTSTESGFGYSIALKETNQLIGHVALWGMTVKDQCAKPRHYLKSASLGTRIRQRIVAARTPILFSRDESA